MSWDILPKANLQYFLQKLKGKLDAIRQGHVIKNSSGTSMTSRDDLQFVGTYVSDDSANGKTKVNIVREFQSVAEIEALTGEAKKGFEVIEDNEEYIPYTGSDILFDNTDTSFEGDNVQKVLEEVDRKIEDVDSKTASDIEYSSGISIKDKIDSIPSNLSAGVIGTGNTILSKLTDTSIPIGMTVWGTQNADDSPQRRTVSYTFIMKATTWGTYSSAYMFVNGSIYFAQTGSSLPSALSWSRIV